MIHVKPTEMSQEEMPDSLVLVQIFEIRNVKIQNKWMLSITRAREIQLLFPVIGVIKEQSETAKN